MPGNVDFQLLNWWEAFGKHSSSSYVLEKDSQQKCKMKMVNLSAHLRLEILNKAWSAWDHKLLSHFQGFYDIFLNFQSFLYKWVCLFPINLICHFKHSFSTGWWDLKLIFNTSFVWFLCTSAFFLFQSSK